MENIFSDDMPDVLTPQNIMKILNLGKNTTYDLLQTGAIKSVRIGNQYRVPQKYVYDFLFNAKPTQT